MSFRTYVDYNDDNVVKAIENVTDRVKEGNVMMNNIDKAIKNAALIYTFDKKGNRTTWEKTLRKVWFNWTTYETIDDDGMANVLGDIGESRWDCLEV
ncbi:MAG: hypothetical protein J6U54_20380 [Clostridiales bacterium]|nr:hypothetical protein [Clostridiales bacterium]